MNYFKQLSQNNLIVQDYQLLQFTQDKIENHDFHNLIYTIQKSSLNKILVSNRYMIKLNYLFNTNKHVEIDTHDWFEKDFENILSNIKSSIVSPQFILITCGGMGSKVLIGELHKCYPSAIYLDVVSGFDFFCTKINTRYQYTNENYVQFFKYLEDIVPNDWNDSKYDWISREFLKTRC